jgi:hypothetical protein
MNHFNTKWKAATLLALGIFLASLMGAQADEREFKGDHPLRVLKARAQNDNLRGSVASAKGNLTIWLQNPTSVVVDGIGIDVELYNDNKRKVETLRREIEKLEPGEKKVITFRWDVVAEQEIHPRFFIEYNARGTQKERFEGDTPTWQ